LHWKLENDEIHVGVAVEANGWVGLGLTEMGGMSGSDIVMFEAAKPKELHDMYGVQNGRPRMDHQQDWKFVDSFVEDGLLAFEATRKLDTGDSIGDWPIEDDSNLLFPGTKLIAAWGDTDEMHYHGAEDRLQASVRFFGDASSSTKDDTELFQEQMKQSEGSIVIKMDDFHVNERYPTWYEHRCFTVTELTEKQGLPADTPIHLIGFEWLLDPGDYVHHIALYSSPSETIKKCDPSGPHSFMHVWNKGQEKNYFFPADVGMLLADESENAGKGLGRVPKSFRLEIHYENQKKVKGARDSSGVRLHYTTKLRKHTGAIMEFGDPRVLLRDKPIGEGLQRHIFGCPASCTTNHVKPAGLTVLYEMLHMHKHGTTMQNVHKREGKEIRRSSVQYYDFDQGAQVVRQTQFKVMPGDSFDTYCNYNGTEKLSFGFEADREMCMAWLLVYPAADIHLSCSYRSQEKGCDGTYERTPIEDETMLGRIFGKEVTEVKTNDSSNSEGESRPAVVGGFGARKEDDVVTPALASATPALDTPSDVLQGKSPAQEAEEAAKKGSVVSEAPDPKTGTNEDVSEQKGQGQQPHRDDVKTAAAPHNASKTRKPSRPKPVGLIKVGAAFSFLLILVALVAKSRKNAAVAYKKLADGSSGDDVVSQTEEGSYGHCPVVGSSSTVRRRVG